jgi:hypothetical protein
MMEFSMIGEIVIMNLMVKLRQLIVNRIRWMMIMMIVFKYLLNLISNSFFFEPPVSGSYITLNSYIQVLLTYKNYFLLKITST